MPVLLVLVAVGGLLGTAQGRNQSGGAASTRTTALRATTAGIEAVLPAKLENALERAGQAGPARHGLPLPLAVLPALLLAWAVARRATLPTDFAGYQIVWALTPPERGPPSLQLVPT